MCGGVETFGRRAEITEKIVEGVAAEGFMRKQGQ
jgi:hypothetical protein